jgi:DNA topoisomerase-1
MKKRVYNKKEEEFIKVNTLNTPFLVIVESPSKCLKIEKYLGFQYKCIASKGHIREIYKVDSAKKNYKTQYSIIKEKENHVKWMKHIVSQFSPKHVILGTDDDREGEGIAWHICEVCNLSTDTTKRIIFHEVTASALKRAIEHPTTIRMNIVKAQQTRQLLDRIIGFQISPVLSRLLVHDNSKFLSAGRCQTPTLRLVYDRFKENEKKSNERLQYKILGTFFSIPTLLNTQLNKYLDSEQTVEKFLEQSKLHNHVITSKPKTIKNKSAPKPFNTSHLLQVASSTLHMSPKYVMNLCQTLYQDGKITYMRTESMKYAKGYLTQCTELITSTYGDFVGELDNLENKDSNNPHEAIRITDLQLNNTDYSDKKINDLYSLIWRRSVESCMSDYQYEEHLFMISAPFEHQYECTIDIPLYLGWKRVTTTPEDMRSTQNGVSNNVAYWKRFENKAITFQKIECILHMKELDKYYNEASLIQKLENLGIGRPSTFSMLIDTIQDRKYVSKKDIEGEEFSGKEFILDWNNIIESKEVNKVFGAVKNKLCIQHLGIQAIGKLLEHFHCLFDYDYTSKMEKELDEIIVNPDKDWKQICEDCENTIKQCLLPLQHIFKTSYRLDDNHEIIFGKSGVMIRYTNGDEKTYKSIKSDFVLDLDKLTNNEYILEDLVELSNDCLGSYNEENVYIRSGPFGHYAVCGDNKISLQKHKNIENVTLQDVIDIIEKPIETNFLREIDENTSVRKGKFGNYIFYKTATMKKPTFINLKKCQFDFLEENTDIVVKWVQERLSKK